MAHQCDLQQSVSAGVFYFIIGHLKKMLAVVLLKLAKWPSAGPATIWSVKGLASHLRPFELVNGLENLFLTTVQTPIRAD